MPPDDQLTQIVMRGQIALRDFLLADLDLAFTLLETARIERTDDPRHSRSAIQKAQEALSVVRSLVGRIEDAEVGKAIRGRADELETALAGRGA